MSRCAQNSTPDWDGLIMRAHVEEIWQKGETLRHVTPSLTATPE